MAIRIRKGPSNGSSPFISFLGITADGVTCSSQYNLVTNIDPQLNSNDPTAVDIINLELTSQQGGIPVYELEAVSFDEWRDEDNLPFASANDVLAYINDIINTTVDKINKITSSPVGVATVTTWVANDNINYQFKIDGGVSYYWNESTFPAGLSVSIFDNRIITGSVAAVGTYPLECEVANNVGITTDIVTLEVV